MFNLSIVLSTFNEVANIKPTLNKLINKQCIKEIIIIDDNSNDGTIDILKTFNNPKIKFKIRKNIRGFASAFIDGLEIAKSDYILRFDLDMYESIDYFLENFNKIDPDTDCLIFSRYINKGTDQRSIYRSFPSLIINKLCQFFLYENIKDYTSCIILFKREILKNHYPKKTNYANFIIEFIFDLKRNNKVIKEIPFKQLKSTELNSKSAPNIFKFIFNGSLYLISIIKCLYIKFTN